MSNFVGGFWSGLTQSARVGVLVAGAVLLSVIAWLLITMFSQKFGVLFSDLSAGDAGAIVTQLKKEKIPYRLSDGGATVSVPQEQVHEVRLGLMSSELPLSGGVGFEIFDKQGLGATEHSQKVSYQRALQGELARTIGSLDNVRQVRVHLVMPESTLFTRDRQQASAAVTVATKGGMLLGRDQIAGIQRLVAAAVPGLDAGHVVVNDHRGVTLSAADSSSGGAGAVEARLDVKRQVEDYMAQKIVRMLDGALGPGQAIVSVDATLNFDATKTTIRDLLPGADQEEGEGRIVRRRQVIGASGGDPVWTTAMDGVAAANRAPGSSTEVEYEYGQRIDEIIAATGALSRLSVGVIVPGDLDESRRAKISDLVKMAAGINASRGDAVSVQSLLQMPHHADGLEMDETDSLEVAQAGTGTEEVHLAPKSTPGLPPFQWMVLGVLVLAVFLLVALLRRRGHAQALSLEERERMLEEIRRALGEDAAGKVRT